MVTSFGVWAQALGVGPGWGGSGVVGPPSPTGSSLLGVVLFPPHPAAHPCDTIPADTPGLRGGFPEPSRAPE